MRRLALLTVSLGLTAPLLVAPPASAGTVTAKPLLGKLTVAKEAGSTTYERSKFRHWIDADGDGCDTREEVLIQESKVGVPTGSGCKVATG